MTRFDKLKRLLRQEYPQYDVRIVRRKIKEGWSGKCWKDGDIYRIQIDPAQDDVAACETLFHEFAHVPSWPEHAAGIQHGPLWGEHYGKCYRIWEVNFLV